MSGRIPRSTRRPAMRAMAAAALLVAGLAATGCSQLAAIAPVGGGRLAEVRFATLDALVGAGVELLQSPVCTASADATITCAGTTVDGRDVTAVSRGSAPGDLEVAVGAETVYSGSLQDLLDRATGEAG